jgi:hypothetical protein
MRSNRVALNKCTHHIRVCKFFFFFTFCLFGPGIISTFGQQKPKMNMDTSAVKQEGMKDIKEMHDQMTLPMAFFTHMGIPLNVGTYSLRAAVLLSQNPGKTNTQFDFQFETGLSKTVGLFIGGEGLFNKPTLEAMVQFLVLKSKNGMNGFSPIIEFEFPLGKEPTRSVYTLVGYAATFSNSRLAVNHVLHYSPAEELAEGSVSMVVKVWKPIYFVTEISGVTRKDTRPVFNVLGGVKVSLNKNFSLGFAFQLPLTNNRNYSSQYIFQPNIMLGK